MRSVPGSWGKKQGGTLAVVAMPSGDRGGSGFRTSSTSSIPESGKKRGMRDDQFSSPLDSSRPGCQILQKALTNESCCRQRPSWPLRLTRTSCKLYPRFTEINLAMQGFSKKQTNKTKHGESRKKSFTDCSCAHNAPERAGRRDATGTTFGGKETHRHLPRETLSASTPQCTDRFLKGKNHRCNIETNLYNHPLIDKTQVLPKAGRVPKAFQLPAQQKPGPAPPPRILSLRRFSTPVFFPWPQRSWFTLTANISSLLRSSSKTEENRK